MKKKDYSLGSLAKTLHCTLVGDPSRTISGVDSLEMATNKDASFLANPRYKEAMLTSQAGVICIDHKTPLIEGKNFFLSEDPSRTFQSIAETILGVVEPAAGFQGIHETATIHPSAEIGEGVTIGPHVVIGPKATIGNRTTIIASSFIGAYTVIGEDCLIYPSAIVREKCSLGNRVILQPGVIIGSCGFGYTIDSETGSIAKLFQLGTVVLEDEVEVGANTTIDRARFKETRIKKGTKIDNLVQIGHNTTIGSNAIIVAQTGIAGSVKVGDRVMMGGQSGVTGHVEIADEVKLATRSGVSKSIFRPGTYRGSPVSPINEFHKREVYLRKIETFVTTLKSLKKQVSLLADNLEKHLSGKDHDHDL